jgi:hypothetical protein
MQIEVKGHGKLKTCKTIEREEIDAQFWVLCRLSKGLLTQCEHPRCYPMTLPIMQIEVKGHGQLKMNITIDRKEVSAQFQVLSQSAFPPLLPLPEPPAWCFLFLNAVRVHPPSITRKIRTVVEFGESMEGGYFCSRH